MLSAHLATDYTLQGWLADGKQKLIQRLFVETKGETK
jgi:hypothetical protein